MAREKPGNLIDRAIELAVKAHEKQRRKGTRTAYITHPFSVGILLSKAGCSDEVIAAGILHDTIEDARIRPSRIEREFGKKVAFIVAKCTEPDKRHGWKKRKQKTLDSLKEAGLDVKFVACADKLHNMRSIEKDYKRIGDRLWDRFRKGREDQKWYYESLLESLKPQKGNPSYEKIYEQLRRTVREVFGKPPRKDS